MNILFIATYAGTSGASQSLISLIIHLMNKGVKPLVLIPNHGPLEKLLIENQIPYKKIRLFNWITTPEKYQISKERFKWFLKRIINIIQEIRIFYLIKSKKIDLVHINAITASWGIYASKLNKTPIVWHIRELLEEGLNKRFWNKQNAMRSLEQAKYVIAISDSVKNEYLQLNNNINLVRIYNGIDSNLYSNARNDLFKTKITKLTLAGRFVPEKGHEETIYALNSLVKNGITNIILRFVGNEGEETFIKKIKEQIHVLELEDYVEFLGYRKDIYNVWAETDIALVCSKAEAFGRVTVEAMMAGALVIGADTGGTVEILSKNYGITYEQGNYSALAKKIEFAVNHKEDMRKIALSGQKYAKKTFTAEKNAENIYKIYKKII